jgi:endonuclease G
MRYVIIFLLAAISAAQASECSHVYPNNQPIVVSNTIELCSSFFGVRYDVTSKAVVVTSELLSPRRHQLKREDSFRPDERLKKPERATIADYTRSGYDKGHMVPAGDANNVDQMRETFRLSNITPQVPALNRGAWRELEYQIRGMVISAGVPVWVVTGAVYSEAPPVVGKNKIPVPSGYYKIVYLPAGTKAYYAHNTDNSNIVTTTVQDINHFATMTLPLQLH